MGRPATNACSEFVADSPGSGGVVRAVGERVTAEIDVIRDTIWRHAGQRRRLDDAGAESVLSVSAPTTVFAPETNFARARRQDDRLVDFLVPPRRAPGSQGGRP